MALKLWNGSSWTSANGLKVWNGSSWVAAQTGRFWNGTSWQIFFSGTNPLFLPSSISEVVVDQVVAPYYGYTRVGVNSDGSLVISTGTDAGNDPPTTYTWKLSGASSEYEAYMSSSTTDYDWTAGNITGDWLNLTTSRFWEFGITMNSGSETIYDLSSTLYIRKISNSFTVSCPVSINLILGAL